MTFHPPSLDLKALETLASKLQQATNDVLGKTVDTDKARDMLAHALGYDDHNGERRAWDRAVDRTYEPTTPNPSVNPALADPHVRKTLWRLLSFQMSSGIAIFDALTEIRQHHAKLGLDTGVADVIKEWQDEMCKGHVTNIGEVLAKHVLPYDLDEGLTLIICSRLGSFSDSLLRIAC